VKTIDITGHKYGKLTVIKRDQILGKKTYWLCLCACGTTKSVYLGNLRQGITNSCGCLKRESIGNVNKSHGMSESRTYTIWIGMRARCRNKKSIRYKSYGGRGISVCDRWVNSFENFLLDMGEAPDGCQLDRIDNDSGYSQDNCRWVTVQENCMNTRQNRIIEYAGEKLTIGEWNRRMGFKRGTISGRLSLGWQLDRAMTEPAFIGKNQVFLARSI
jgi:hypothetical protein